jgi:hypothetical protein
MAAQMKRIEDPQSGMSGKSLFQPRVPNMIGLNHAMPSTSRQASGLLPTLIIAGAPRSGTTSLFRWLADHPDVLGSTVKETYYFVDPGTHMFDSKQHFLSSGIDGYRRFFPKGEESPRLVVEATPSYLYSELAIRELPQLSSRPHFIFLLREPASQIHSAFRYFQSNWDWIPANMSFSDFLAASDSGTHHFKGNELAQNALRNAAYVDFLLRWQEACGVDRLHVFLFEEAFSDERRFMRRLAEQFGIDAGFYDTYNFPSENQTYSVRSKGFQKLNIALRSWLPQGTFYKTVRSLYRHINTQVEAPEERLEEELEIVLAERYRRANERLADEFKLDLKAWNAVQESRRARQRHKEEGEHVTC